MISVAAMAKPLNLRYGFFWLPTLVVTRSTRVTPGSQIWLILLSRGFPCQDRRQLLRFLCRVVCRNWVCSQPMAVCSWPFRLQHIGDWILIGTLWWTSCWRGIHVHQTLLRWNVKMFVLVRGCHHTRRLVAGQVQATSKAASETLEAAHEARFQGDPLRG